MSTGIIILARMDSSRMPGKVLADIAGTPLLERVWQRVKACTEFPGGIVVATTDRTVDIPITAWCATRGIPVHHGPAEDVAGRLVEAAATHGFTVVARVNADSPLIDPGLLDNGARLMTAQGEKPLDYVTNLHPRSFPYGVAVEIFRCACLEDLLKGEEDPSRREHVTQVLYKQSHLLSWCNIARSGEPEIPDLPSIVLTVDTPRHLDRLRVFAATRQEDWAQVPYMEAVHFGGFA